MSNIKIGDKVKMSEDFKKRAMVNSKEHIDEFGECEGYAEEGEISDFDVRWEPSGLKYGYDENDLVKVVDMNKPANVVLNEVILECEAQCGTPFYENLLKAMRIYGEQEAERRERLAYRKGLREMAEHKDKEIKEMENEIKKIEDEIDQRIAHLISVDAEFCQDRWDMTKPEMERNIYREMSNQVTATRQELQMLKKNLGMKENNVEPDMSVRAIAHKSYNIDLAAFAEGCGKPFNALAWHVFKRAFDIASYTLPNWNKQIKEKAKALYDEAYNLKEHCIDKKLIDWEDDSIDGCKDFDKAMNEIREILDGTMQDVKLTVIPKEIKITGSKFNGEYIICSAVRWKNIAICGRRHKDCYNIADALMNGGFLERERKHQGFMTSTGRFVDREEAFKIAKENNQIIHKMFDNDSTGSLTSEDLFGMD